MSQLQKVPESEWPTHCFDPYRIEVWKSRRHLVQVFSESSEILRVSVNTVVAGKADKWVDGITWEELMEIKRQIGRGHEYAVEVLPRDKDIVNVANIRHFWILPEPVCGWLRDQ